MTARQGGRGATAAPAPRRRTPRKRSVLPVLVVLFVASAVVRLAGDTGRLIAQEFDGHGSEADPAAVAMPAACPAPAPELAALLGEVQERERSVAEREAAVDEREVAVALAQDEVRQSLDALEQAESRLSATIAAAATASENDLSQLTSVYENMKPAVAALLFEQMDPVFSAGFLGRMRPDAAAAILSGLSPEKAYSISVVLAGRNADVPTE